MSKIQLLSGPSVDEALEETAVRHLFRYKLNPATLGVLLILGAAGFAAAGYLWFIPGLGGTTTALFIGALLLGMTFFSMASFWGNFRNNHFVAVSDDYLFVGKDEQAWRIHWSLVDRDTLRLDEMKSSRFRGKVHLETAGQSVEIPLYTPFVFVEDIEGLMFELLQRLEAEGGEAPVGAPDRGDDIDDADDEAGNTENDDGEKAAVDPPADDASRST